MNFLPVIFNILLIILGFGVLIFVHELGHFIAAKWAGIRAEAFAIGMGPVVLAWRKGIGLRFGSTAAEYERRVREFLAADEVQQQKVKEETKAPDELPPAEFYRIGDKLGLGETEYSLRWLPIGGFVKMLGQEDANPNYVSNDPRSYTMCPVGKRMIVVSAGVIMNIILAVILFIIAFMIGVNFPAPVIGDVAANMPAGQAVPVNPPAGINTVGLQPADEVIQIDGESAVTFADIEIGSAMSHPGRAIEMVVRRAGLDEPLRFSILPQKDPATGLLGIGVGPAKSTRLWDKDEQNLLAQELEETGLQAAGVTAGMQMVRAGDRPVSTYQQFQKRVEASNGEPVVTEWQAIDRATDEPAGPVTSADMPAQPRYSVLRYPDVAADELQNFESGLLGLTPLVEINPALKSANSEVLRKGDVVLRINAIDAPRQADFRREVKRNAEREVELLLLRAGERIKVAAKVDRKGRLNVLVGYAFDLPLIAQPMAQVKEGAGKDASARPTPVAGIGLVGLSRLQSVEGQAIENWPDFRRALRSATEAAAREGTGATVSLTALPPTGGGAGEAGRGGAAQSEMYSLALSPEDVRELHELSWATQLDSLVFDPVYTLRTADGNPVRAVVMGFEETKKVLLLTYLTIDRLFRRSVGVDQLRGPLGIVHIGSKLADRGLTYVIFFLAMISVNLAVINFLPMPIVDGGLFLFLVYEKIKGRPPSVAFQNAATVVGLCLIATLFLVVTWNDVMRLVS